MSPSRPRSRVSATLVAAGVLLASGLLVAPAAAATGAAPDIRSDAIVRADFNGDGFSDLVVGVPSEDLDDADQGAVQVIYGSASGLTSTENQFWSQDSNGILDEGFGSEDFGSAVDWADFDGDGYDDLVVGVPRETVGAKDNAGAVNVIYGSAEGLTSTGNQFWTQDSADVAGTASKEDLFGTSVTGRDFDNDGFEDLAVGAIGDGFPNGSGTVTVLYGSPSGLVAQDSQELEQMKGKPERGDRFGQALAAGDFDDDGYPDLAIGVDQENVAGVDDAGAVNIVYGSADGLTATGNQFWHQGRAGILDDPEAEEWLGRSLSVGDFNGDGYVDLTAGIIWENVGAIDGAGAAMVLYGSGGGLTAAGNQLWNQDSAGVLGTAEPFDTNGDVAGGDFNGDGFSDLAMGFHGEDLAGLDAAGTTNVIYGSAAGLTSAGNQAWYQDTADIEDVGEPNDRFGYTVARGDFDGDGYYDLVIGVLGESVGAVEGAGAVHVLYGTAAGLAAAGDQLWNQNSAGILDQAEQFEAFGSALTRH